ncbi:Vab2 [Kluyveromyces lactis]|nr:Vab2 [Kluyveromyces lactis]
MSFLFYGDPKHPRKRESFHFETIEKSDYSKQLQSLPLLPSSSSLRQDHIFSNVAKEVHQISDDVAIIYSRLQEEIDTEQSQTKEINDKINHSVKKLESSFSKLVKLRTKFTKNSDKQLRQFESKYSDIDKKVRIIRDANEELLEYVTRNGSIKVDATQFRKISKLLQERFPEGSNMTETDADKDNSGHSLNEGHAESVNSSNSRQSTNGSQNNAKKDYHSTKGNSADSNTTKSYRQSISSAPLALSSIRSTSRPSIATTLEHICITEPFTRPRGMSKSADL